MTRGHVAAVAFIIVALALLFGTRPAHGDEGDEVARYVPSARSGREVVREIAEMHFAAEDVPWAVRTAKCESGYDLYAYSAGFDHRLGVWYEFVGALQTDAVTWRAKAAELFGGSIAEPMVNFALAAWIYAKLGPSHWPVCGQ